MISRCFWFDNLTELRDTHGEDIFANWTGETFALNDVVFVYDDDGELQLYTLVLFSDTEVEDVPRQIIGPVVSGKGASVWRQVVIAYTSAAVDLDRQLSMSCADSDNVALTCEFLDKLNGDITGIMLNVEESISGSDLVYDSITYHYGIADNRLASGLFSFNDETLYLAYFDTLI